MGVDCGLPDFRGPEGFWRAYPPYAKLGLDFARWPTPAGSATTRPSPGASTATAWGSTADPPARGLRHPPALGRRGCRAAGSSSPRTSTASSSGRASTPTGWSRSTARSTVQCLAGCGVGVFPADPSGSTSTRDDAGRGPVAGLPAVRGMARPNILMFGDGGWDRDPAAAQEGRLRAWLGSDRGRRVVVVECGAGTAIPSVRWSARCSPGGAGTLVRINLREPEVPDGHIPLPLCRARRVARHRRLVQADLRA